MSSCIVLAGNEGCTTTTCGEAAAMVTGAKLFTASYGTLLDTVGATAKSLVTNRMVCPSPGEFAAVPVATTPLAPVRFDEETSGQPPRSGAVRRGAPSRQWGRRP